MAKIIKTSGEEILISPRNNKEWSLEELKSIVGGYIEICDTVDDGYLVINEDGKLLDLDLNCKATALYKYGRNDYIVGDALYIPSAERKTLS